MPEIEENSELVSFIFSAMLVKQLLPTWRWAKVDKRQEVGYPPVASAAFFMQNLSDTDRTLATDY